MYAPNDAGPVTVDKGHGVATLATRLTTALILAVIVWIGMMVLAAAAARLVTALVPWVGVFVLDVLGSGIRVPMSGVPHSFMQLTAVWPTFHITQLVHCAVGNGGVDVVPHVLSLGGVAALFLVIARRGLRKVR